MCVLVVIFPAAENNSFLIMASNCLLQGQQVKQKQKPSCGVPIYMYTGVIESLTKLICNSSGIGVTASLHFNTRYNCCHVTTF